MSFYKAIIKSNLFLAGKNERKVLFEHIFRLYCATKCVKFIYEGALLNKFLMIFASSRSFVSNLPFFIALTDVSLPGAWL